MQNETKKWLGRESNLEPQDPKVSTLPLHWANGALHRKVFCYKPIFNKT